MDEESIKANPTLHALHQALEAWARHGNEQPLTRWFTREVDSNGAPRNLGIADWRCCLESLVQVEPRDRVLPTSWIDGITRLVKAVYWFSRPDATPGTVFENLARPRPIVWKSLLKSNACHDPAVARALKNWLAKQTSASAETDFQRVLGVLRPGWPESSDFLAIDHRNPGSTCRIELFGGGRSWLGPTWKTDVENPVAAAPRPRSWITNTAGSLAEWSYRAGEVRITQSVLMLRGRSLALLSALVEQRSTLTSVPGFVVSLPPGLLAGPVVNSRALLLSQSNKRGSAQVLPIGLPSLPYTTDRGAFRSRDDDLALNQTPQGRRCWMPLLVSWDFNRHRKELDWRILSVSERARNVPPDRAFAVRVSWGRDETYVIYRSLAKPAARAFLGHQTHARLLVGFFKPDGAVETIFRVG